MTALSMVNFSALVNLPPDKQIKDLVLAAYHYHQGTVTCFSTVCENPDTHNANCYSIYMYSPILQDVCTHFPRIQMMFMAKTFYKP